MAPDDTDSRFGRLSREILNGSLPYGLSPGQPPPDRFAVVLSHDLVAGATAIVCVTPDEGARCALTLRSMTLATADRVQRDFAQFMDEMHLGEHGEMLPFSFLPRRVAIRRLKRLTNAN